jgi:hypothetical protein
MRARSRSYGSGLSLFLKNDEERGDADDAEIDDQKDNDQGKYRQQSYVCKQHSQPFSSFSIYVMHATRKLSRVRVHAFGAIVGLFGFALFVHFAPSPLPPPSPPSLPPPAPPTPRPGLLPPAVIHPDFQDILRRNLELAVASAAKKQADIEQRLHSETVMQQPPPMSAVVDLPPALPYAPVVDQTSVVSCSTTKGLLRIAVYDGWSPNGSRRFIELVESGFFSSKVAQSRGS